MKRLPEEQNNSRKGAKAQRVAKQTKEFPFALLCVSVRQLTDEIVLFFTASDARATSGASGTTTVLHLLSHRLLRSWCTVGAYCFRGFHPWLMTLDLFEVHTFDGVELT